MHVGRTGWQPLTARGAALFARAPLRRLLLVQLFFAVLASVAGAWFLSENWYPTIRAAIHELPSRGEIRAGRLDWPAESPRLLSEGNFLAWVVDLNHSGRVRSPAHVQVEFGRTRIRIISLFGFVDCAYPDPPGRVVSFNRPELEPWWGAWGPPILWISVAVFLAVLAACWLLMATVYCWPVWVAGFFMNRDLNLGGSWKVAGAALMPGTLLQTAGLVAYGWGGLDLVGLLVVAAARFLADWIYLFFGVFFAPRLERGAPARGNPFAGPGSGASTGTI